MVSAIILISGLFSFHAYRQSMERQIGEFVPQVLLQANRQVESYVSDLLNVSQWVLMPPYDKTVAAALTDINQSESRPSLKTTLAIQQFMESLKMRTTGPMSAFSLYSLTGYVYEYDQTGGSWRTSDLSSQIWYPKLDQVYFSQLVLGTVNGSILGPDRADRSELVFSVVQPIRRAASKELLGVLQVSGTLDSLRTIMSGTDFGPGSTLYVVDDRDMIVYASAPDKIGKPWDEPALAVRWQNSSAADSKLVRIGNREYLASYNWSAGTGWKIIAVIPKSNISKGISAIGTWTTVLIVVGVGVAALLSIALSYGFTGRIRRLSRHIRSLQMDELRLNLDIAGYDEIGYLSDSFRKLVGRVRNLVEEVLTAKLLKQEAEIKALQSQINPHFLYNVLESIRMTVKQGHLEEVESSLVSLGYVLRNQIFQDTDSVPLRRELAFIEQYLRIQKLRLGDKLETEWDVAPETEDAEIPRMIFQPLVENALTHGRSPHDHSVQLTIRIYPEAEMLVIDIIDEGAGMSEARLSEVLEGLSVGFTSDRRIGLANVYQRIKHIYGSRGDMRIDSSEGAGTIVSIRLPAYGERPGRDEGGGEER